MASAVGLRHKKIGAAKRRKEILTLRLVQTEIACLRVGRYGDLQATVVGRRHFDGALPVRQAQVRRGFENESGGRERPGNYSRGAVAAHNRELNASGGAGVQHYRHAIAISDGEVEFTISIKVAYRDGIGARSRTVIEGGLKSTIAVAQQHRDAAGELVGKHQASFICHREVELVIAVEIT